MKLQTCSLAARGVTYDEVEAGYYEQVEALYEGGVDLFLVETIFDTLNAKAALFALERFFAEKVGGLRGDVRLQPLAGLKRLPAEACTA